MTRDEWEGLSLLIEEWWPGEFTDVTAGAWFDALGGFDREAVFAAMKACLAHGGRWRPAVSEIIAAIRRDPSQPTPEEIEAMIYGLGGILRARPTERVFADWGEMGRAKHEAMLDRARQLHPLVFSFVQRYGLDRLAALEVDHETYGQANRKQLREAWERHCEAMEGRDVAALVAGRRGEIGRFDPLRALTRTAPLLLEERGG